MPKPKTNKSTTKAVKPKKAVKPRRQVRNAMYKKGRSSMVPVAIANSSSTVNNASETTMSGFEYIDAAEVAFDATTGTNFVNLPLAPQLLATTRLLNAATIWDYYRFKRLRVHLEPANPSTVGGQVAFAVDPNPDEAAGDTVPYILALPGAKTSSMWQPSCVDFDCKNKYRQFPWFITSSIEGHDPDEAIQARLIATLSQGISGLTAGTVGFTIKLEYVVQFARRKLALTVGPVPQLEIPIGSDLKVGPDGFLNEVHYTDGIPTSGTIYVCDPAMDTTNTGTSITTGTAPYLVTNMAGFQALFADLGTAQAYRLLTTPTPTGSSIVGSNAANAMTVNVILAPLAPPQMARQPVPFRKGTSVAHSVNGGAISLRQRSTTSTNLTTYGHQGPSRFDQGGVSSSQRNTGRDRNQHRQNTVEQSDVLAQILQRLQMLEDGSDSDSVMILPPRSKP